MNKTIRFFKLSDGIFLKKSFFNKTFLFFEGEWWKPLKNDGTLDRIHNQSIYSTYCIIETIHL